MNYSEEQKQQLLTKNKSFCMLPWISMHVTPVGVAVPCCIGAQVHNVGNANEKTLMELVNSEGMSQLRRDMLDDVKNPICSACHRHEEQNVPSFRSDMNDKFGKYLDEVLSVTDSSGEIGQFKMRYFDLRLSNICNMKCRTCNSHYSSLWENEDIKQGRTIITVDKTRRYDYVNETLKHVPFLDMAYFAGGEPLISEDHYTMLEEMIKLGRTDVLLRYNTNFSTLKYKNKDLLELWSHFTKKVEVYASIDSYGKRAEYIRSGTNWDEIEENFRKVKEVPYVNMLVNTVVSIFNFVSLGDFYHYLLDKKLYTPDDRVNTIYNMISPVHLTALALPMHLKLQGIDNINSVVKRMESLGFKPEHRQALLDATKWVLAENTWETYKDKFIEETKHLDNIREEKFTEVFPELIELLE